MNIEKRLGCDPIDDSIYRCFVDGQSWCFAESLAEGELRLSESKQGKIYFPRREQILDEIARVYADHGGKLYKSKAKGGRVGHPRCLPLLGPRPCYQAPRRGVQGDLLH